MIIAKSGLPIFPLRPTFPAIRRKLCRLALLAIAGAGLVFAPPGQAQDAAPDSLIWSIEINGPIGPASADYLTRNIAAARDNEATLLLLKLDTPGGLDTAMRDMIQAILASPVPVVTYVSPSGARAASAGTYLLYASHIAAMTPASNLGAATPVQLGSPGLPSMPEPATPPDGSESDEGSSEDAEGSSENTEGSSRDAEGSPNEPAPASLQPQSAMERKLVNDAVAYIQSLAELRGRNAEWAEKAVREGASLSAQQALALGVIDLVADDQNHLLTQLDGRTLDMGDRQITLATGKARVLHQAPDWRNQLLAIITNPNVAYLLMLVGIYGLIFEFSNPGMGGPGILGAICLGLALYAFNALPISYVGVGLIVIGIAFMAVEALSPSFGVAGVGGVAAFVIGSVMLMDTQLPAYQIALPVVLAVAVASFLLMVFALGMVVRSTRHAVVSGTGTLVGQIAVVEQSDPDNVLVHVNGELWRVDGDTPLDLGDRVRITAVNNLSLRVEKITGEMP